MTDDERCCQWFIFLFDHLSGVVRYLMYRVSCSPFDLYSVFAYAQIPYFLKILFQDFSLV